MANTLLRTSSWFISLAALIIVTLLYWSFTKSSSKCDSPFSSTQDLFLVSFLFLHRGMIEVYRKYYSLASSSSSSSSIFSGRSALWVRLFASLVLVIVCLFAVVENAVTIFTIEEKDFVTDADSRSSSPSSSSVKRDREKDSTVKNGFDEKFLKELHEESEASKKVYNRHNSIVDADRSSFNTLARSKRNLENHKNAFSPGAVPHYQLLLHHNADDDQEQQQKQNQKQNVNTGEKQQQLCSLSSSFMTSTLFVWVFYCASVAVMFWSMKTVITSSSSTKKNASSNMNNNNNKSSKDQIVENHGSDCDEKNINNNTASFALDMNETGSLSPATPLARTDRQLSLCWALHFDFMTEIKLISNLAALTFLVNLGAHFSLSLHPTKELPCYHSFVTGLVILHSEVYNSCLPSLRALSLSLTEREVKIVEGLENALNGQKNNFGSDNNSDGAKSAALVLKAYKTHFGTLNLVVRAKSEGGNEVSPSTVKERVREVVKTSALWERVFEVESMKVRIV